MTEYWEKGEATCISARVRCSYVAGDNLDMNTHRTGLAFLGLVGISLAASGGDGGKPLSSFRPVGPAVAYELPSEVSTEYATGKQVVTQWAEVWTPMCGCRPGALNNAGLIECVHAHDAAFEDPSQITIVDTPQDGLAANVNIVFALGSTVPAAAIPAFTRAEAYLESLFTDPITVNISVSFAAMGSGILGGTSPSYTTATYTAARAGLVSGADASDTLQASLPTGSSIGVRYSGTSSTITAENRVYFTRANYKAAVGTSTGTDATMQFNSAFSWDYDPTNGISGYSFVDVLIHEVGHALGFVCGAGVWSKDMSSLDLFRFQTTDGTADYNPDTLAEWTARPRLVAYNSPNDAHHSDFVTVEYPMSDGSPYQASHFREQSANIGIMDPAFASGQTYYPNYMKASDTTAFDAIGWDR